MPEQHRTDAEAPDRQSPATDDKEYRRQQNRRQQIEAIDPAQLGIAVEVSDQLRGGVVVAVRKNPADMCPPEAEARGRMEVFLSIRVAVVMPVVASPPEHAFLY